MAFAISAAFVTYFCMYAFRKPFAAGSYEGSVFLSEGLTVSYKTLYVVSQILGYAVSKYVGIRFCSEARRRHRLTWLVLLIVFAEVALIAFGALPTSMPMARGMALFANGLPLGMVWGLVVLYLEGRRTSEVLLTGLSCSYILASGIVKDIGRALIAGASIPLPLLTPAFAWQLPNPLPPINEYWMPAVTGALFLLPYVISAWLLDQLPDPDRDDIDLRTERAPMSQAMRASFLRAYAAPLSLALASYFLLTAHRDFRDNYMVEVFSQLGYDYASNREIVSRSEIVVAFGVMALLSQLYRVQDNRRGLIATYALMTAGLLLIGVATLLLDIRVISGFWWVTAIGLGGYLCYVPYGSVLFDRSIASARFVGTAVFGIYLADAVGYTGSVLLQLTRDLVTASWSHVDFLRTLSYAVSLGGSFCLVAACYLFMRKTNAH